jgi:hypothetical protein
MQGGPRDGYALAVCFHDRAVQRVYCALDGWLGNLVAEPTPATAAYGYAGKSGATVGDARRAVPLTGQSPQVRPPLFMV